MVLPPPPGVWKVRKQSNQDLRVNFLQYREYDAAGKCCKKFTWITDLHIARRGAHPLHFRSLLTVRAANPPSAITLRQLPPQIAVTPGIAACS